MGLTKCASSLAVVAIFFVLCAVVPSLAQTSVNLTRWAQPLPRPGVHQPYDRCGGVDRYNVTIGVFKHQFHPDLPVVDLYGYGGSYPGLTFEAEVGRPIFVLWQNRLPEGHILPTQVLVTPDMGIENPPNSSSVVHLHGAHVQPDSDGFPLDYITQNEEYVFHYPNKQLPLTMWYHDHVMTRTRANVHAGLAGFYFLRDKDEHLLGLPRGEYEMPIVIQDRVIQADGRPFYPFTWGAFAGDTVVVNGKAFPYVEVQPRAYRLRILNACNERFLRLSIPDGPSIWQIGSDGGFLNEAVLVKQLLLGPSERADIIVDFYGHDGETLFFRNTAAPGFAGQADGDADPPFQQVLQFRVLTTGGAERPYSFPSLKHVAHLPPLPKLEEIPPNEIAQVRNLTLRIVVTPGGAAPIAFLINGRHFHEEPEETPIVGTTEIWNIINLTPLTHPIHVHLVQFRILQRRPFNTTSFVDGQPPQFTGPARIPDLNDQGWKDVAKSNPGEVTTIMATFKEFVGWYVFHCHMLEHEDNDMMHPLVVQPADGSPAPPAPGGRFPTSS